MQGTVDFGGGPLVSAGLNDVFLAKFDSNCKHLWSKRFGDANDQQGNTNESVAIDSMGNVFIAGRFQGTMDFGGGPLTSAGSVDAFLAKFDRDGKHLWSKRFGDADEQRASGLAVDPVTGAVVLGGTCKGTVDFGGGPLSGTTNLDVVVAKFDASGNHQWSKRFGDTAHQYTNAVAIDSGGNTLVSGAVYGAIDFGGPAGSLVSAGANDVFVAKLSPDGATIWSKRFGDAASQLAFGIAVDGKDGVLLTGSMAGTIDFGGGSMTSAGGRDVFIARLDQSGSYSWASRFGDALEQLPGWIDADASGNVLITGTFGGAIDFGGGAHVSEGASDMFVAKLDAAGKHLWSKRFGDAADQVGSGIFDAAGNVILAGAFAGTVDFGVGPMTSAGGRDLFLAKLSP
jgi:hypothetical protein